MTPNRWYTRQAGLALIAIAMLVTACGDDPTLPQTSKTGPRISFSSTPGGGTLPPLHSSTVKYRDAGKKPGIGRSGSAALTARGLLAKNGETLLEITTGALDDGSAPGNLDKIQIKTMDPNGAVLAVVNYNKLKSGGYASYGILNLVPGSQIQVQSNVSGIDPTRTDVVTVLESVKRRPDPAVASVDAPARALPHAPVTIGATVQERNGDVGARANCVLYIDGAEADRADGIWIDAASTISCAFTHTFATTGSKQVLVAVETVRPDDWDTSNNSANTTIEVTAATNVYWYASASDFTHDHLHRGDWSWSYGPDQNGLTGAARGDYETREHGRYQHGYQTGWIDREIAFPIERMEFSHESNGAILLSTSFDNVPADWTYAYESGGWVDRQACAVRVTQTQQTDLGEYWYVWAQVCSAAYGPSGSESAWTTIDQSRWAGEVTYFSRNQGEQWFRNADGSCYPFSCYTWNYGPFAGTRTAGMPLPELGPDYTMRGVVWSGATSYRMTSVVPLFPHNYSFTQPYACRDWANGFYRGRDCYEYSRTETGVSGSAVGAPDPVP